MGPKIRQEMPKNSSSTASPAKNQFFVIKEVISIQHYETTDIFLGAFLLSSGGDLSGISFNDRQIATFMFTGADLYQLDQEYRTGTALVNPVHLRASLNHLRDLLFDMRERRRKRDDKPRRNRHHQARR
jgi:hypothetical protein